MGEDRGDDLPKDEDDELLGAQIREKLQAFLKSELEDLDAELDPSRISDEEIAKYLESPDGQRIQRLAIHDKLPSGNAVKHFLELEAADTEEEREAIRERHSRELDELLTELDAEQENDD